MAACRRFVCLLRLALVACVCAVALPSPVVAETLRLRITWGGGPERTWQGRIVLSEGTLANPVPLGVHADQSGAMWLEQEPEDDKAGSTGDGPPPKPQPALVIRSRSPRSYEAVDLQVTAPLEATLSVQLSPAAESREPGWLKFRLADVLQGSQAADLDDRGNRLVVRRAPGDELQVKIDRSSLVFSPGESLDFEVQPNLLPVEPGAAFEVSLQLFSARTTQRHWAQQYALSLDKQATLPVSVPLPETEGAYDIVISAVPAARRRWASAMQFGNKPAAIERTIQVLVVDPERSSPSAQDGRLAVVAEIDPEHPRWWTRLKLPQWSRLRAWKGPLGNDRAQIVAHPLGNVTQLAPNGNSGEISWEAFILPIERAGEPHVLEVEYPSDVPQTFGVSVIEPNAAGAVAPFGLDSGVDQAEEIAALPSKPSWRRHRLVFWPRTKTPVVLLTNRREHGPAVFGKIRILAGWQHLPPASLPSSPSPQRLLAGYLDRPLFPENFSATEASAPGESSLDDWLTFHEGGTRLIEYLHYAGYNGLMLSAMADGSTIYPSDAVQPTPQYDSGAMFGTGQDPIRKDVLEMLLRLFDREKLQLIPALEFSATFGDLEEVIRRGGPAAVGMQWIGPDGKTWNEVYRARQGRAPHYNVLHPRVQEKMLDVVREVTRRGASHPSFAGLSLQLAPYGYAQLPGPEWGLDDVTIAVFQRETGIRLPDDGPTRFADRLERLSQLAADGRREWRREWLEWRAARLGQFYRRVEAELQAAKPGAKLYLVGAELLTQGPLAAELRPSLPQRMTMAEAMLQVGIDSRLLAERSSIVLVRPERIAPQWALARRAVDLEAVQMPDADRYFHAMNQSGSLFYHEPQEARLPSLDEQCPFKPCYGWLATQPVPSAQQNRRRFIRSLAALDSQVMLDGGWMLSMGQEDSLRDLIAVYRQLPAIKLDKAGGPSEAGQPVTIRFGSGDGVTHAYAVNEAAFPTRTRVQVEAPQGCRLDEVAGSRPAGSLRRDAEGLFWEFDLGPYDIVAVRFSSPGVRLFRPRVAWPDEVRQSLEKLVTDLGDRANALGNPPILDIVPNLSFDQPSDKPEQVPNWKATAPGIAAIDSKVKHDGSQSLRLSSDGPAGGVVSQAFAAPATGRLSIAFWLRVANPARQPTLRIALEGECGERGFMRYAWFGEPGPQQPAAPAIAAEWSMFVVHVGDLPLDAPCPLRLRLELMGPGEVWIDEIQLSDLAFSRRERVELYRLIMPVEVKLEAGQLGDCVRLLEGYWPRFLVNHVRPAPVARREPAPSAPPPEPSSPGFADRLRAWVPERLRF